MKDRTVAKFNTSLIIAYSMITAFYLTLGVIGALSYGQDVPNLVVFRSHYGTDWLMVIGKLLVGLYLTISTIVVLNPTRTGILNFIYYDGYTSTPQVHNTTNIALLSLSCVFAIILPDILFYFKIIGGCLCGYIAFALPTLFYLKVEEDLVLRGIVAITGAVFSLTGVAIVIDIFV